MVEIMETIKNALFNVIVIIGLVAIILGILWGIIELLNRFFKFTKHTVIYYRYKVNEYLYDLENNIILSKDGEILHSCIQSFDGQIKAFNRAIDDCNKSIKFREKYKSN